MTDLSVKKVVARVNGELSSVSKTPVVLVVEEEAAIRDLLLFGLQNNGFTVYLASNGQEAVSLFASLQWEVNVVLLDWSRTGMSGPQTLEALREMNPGLPCCFMTAGHVASDCPDVPILSKPFSIDTVTKKLLMLVQ